jgi:hypothetical protein
MSANGDGAKRAKWCQGNRLILYSVILRGCAAICVWEHSFDRRGAYSASSWRAQAFACARLEGRGGRGARPSPPVTARPLLRDASQRRSASQTRVNALLERCEAPQHEASERLFGLILRRPCFWTRAPQGDGIRRQRRIDKAAFTDFFSEGRCIAARVGGYWTFRFRGARPSHHWRHACVVIRRGLQSPAGQR